MFRWVKMGVPAGMFLVSLFFSGSAQAYSDHFRMLRTLDASPDSSAVVYHPWLTLDENGNPWIAWDRPVAGKERIFIAGSNDRGITFNNPSMIVGDSSWQRDDRSMGSPVTDLDVFDPAMVVRDGNIYLVYRRVEAEIDQLMEAIVFRRSRDFGMTFDPPVVVSSVSGHGYRNPSIVLAMDDIVISWEETMPDSNPWWNVRVTRSDDGGMTFQPTVQASMEMGNASETTLLYNPSEDEIYISFIQRGLTGYHNKSCFFNKSDRENLAFPTESVQVGGHYRGLEHPSIALQYDGMIKLAAPVIDLQDSCFTVRLFESGDDGETFTTLGRDLSRTPRGCIASKPVLALDGKDFEVFWLDRRSIAPGAEKIYVMYRNSYDEGEELLLNPVILKSFEGEFESTPCMVRDGLRNITHVVFADSSCGLLYYTRSIRQKVLVWDNDTDKSFLDSDDFRYLIQPSTELVKMLVDAGIPEDSIIVTKNLADKINTTDYSALFVTLGWRDPFGTGGVIGIPEMQTIRNFMDSSGYVYIEGNDFVKDNLYLFPAFPDYFGITEAEDGDAALVDSLYMVLFNHKTYPFPMNTGPDSYMDIITGIDTSATTLKTAFDGSEENARLRGLQSADISNIRRVSIVNTFPIGALCNFLTTTRTGAMVKTIDALFRRDYDLSRGVVEEIHWGEYPIMSGHGDLLMHVGDTLTVKFNIRVYPGLRQMSTPLYIYVVPPGSDSRAEYFDKRTIDIIDDRTLEIFMNIVIEGSVFDRTGSYEIIFSSRPIGESFLRSGEIANLEIILT